MTTPLPPIDPTAPDDQLPGEAELAALYRQLPCSEPAPALDAAVLHAATQALAAGEHPLAVERRRGPRERGDWVRPKGRPLPDFDSVGVEPRRRAPRWLLTLGSAASLVLVAGLAWHLRERPASVPAAPASAAPTTSAAADAGVAPTADQQPDVLAETTAAKAAPPPLSQASMKARADTSATRAAAAPAASDAAAQARSGSLAQDRELAAIRQLFAEHHDEDAQRRLEDFRRHYPQRELPEDLRLHLRQP